MDPYWNKRILGIDPGYAIVGFGLIQAGFGRYEHIRHGAITTPANMKAHDRLVTIYEDMCTLLDAVTPDEVAMEKLFFNTNTTTAMGVSQARGVILLSIAQRGIPIYEYSPSQIKQAVVGYGKAEKLQMMEMTRQLLRLPSMPKPDDAADGLAAALCHATMRTSQLYRE